MPYADWVLFRRSGSVRALQNIGGIANVTVVGERLADVFAFDNGPGNMIIDALAEVASGGAERYDRDGALSAQGHVAPHLLDELLDDDFLRRPPPKSTVPVNAPVTKTLAVLGSVAIPLPAVPPRTLDHL